MTAHFQASEFSCPDCGIANVSPVLLEALEDLRYKLGNVPLTILRGGGCRCPTYNGIAQGAGKSQHITTETQECKAADVKIPHGYKMGSVFFAAAAVRAFAKGGIGIYPQRGFIHVDVRDNRARWGYLHGYTDFATAWNWLKQRDEGEGLV